MYFKELVSICHGTILQISEDWPVQLLLIDSRKTVVSEGSLFFAIKGERHDGHLFIAELYHLGIRQFIVEQEISIRAYPGANFLMVQSSVTALQQIAAHHRNNFTIPVVGITGSNGKTIVKEWLFQLLSLNLRIVKNPGSYNSQVGVPLSVWQIQSLHELAIFEAGISQPGEMEKLQAMIRPTHGIFTNLGGAHDENFASLEEKANEKAKLFLASERVVYCRDHELVHETLHRLKIPTFSWSLKSKADVIIRSVGPVDFEVSYKAEQFTLQLPFPDIASQENAFHAISFMLMRGYKSSVIAERIKTLKSIPMRLELKQGINRCTIIDDSYNNDIAGLHISLDFLRNQQKAKKALILSDVHQSGLSDVDLIKEIGGLIAAGRLTKFIGVGPVIKSNSKYLPAGAFYESTSEFLERFDPDEFADEVILVKGARAFQFERIVQRLLRKVHGTVMEVDLSCMVHNLNYFKSQLKPSTKMMVMVKAFAYGSGSEEVANLLQYHRADYLGVAYADEGVELRKNNITLPIMVMNPSEESFSLMLQYRLEPEMYNLRILKALVEFLDGQPCSVHLKLDTGMHRLGFEESELDLVMGILGANKNISVASVFSHLSGSDEKIHDDFSKQQALTFQRLADRLQDFLGYRPLRHLLNSPGILRLPEYQFDMVRLGIGLYGVDPTEEGKANLKPVTTLKTVISQIKTIKAGETIGYGRRGKAEKQITLATLAIGYADGFSRGFSRGQGSVLIQGQLAPVVGNVCMDMTMVDITGIPASEGDEAIIFGPGLPIQQVAKWIDTIPYEILTNTSERVKRVFFAESI